VSILFDNGYSLLLAFRYPGVVLDRQERMAIYRYLVATPLLFAAHSLADIALPLIDCDKY
jgi:hypothetical protein